MVLIVKHFREYLTYYLCDYLELENLDFSNSDWQKVLHRMESKVDADFRMNYLRFFLWSMNDEMLIYYKTNPHYHGVLRQSVKVLSIIGGEFLRFNDYETKEFVNALQTMSGEDLQSILTEPVEPFYEDIIHFVDNFINWYKKKQGIPLTHW